eukprot:208187_1
MEGDDSKEDDYLHKNNPNHDHKRAIDTKHRIDFKCHKFLLHTEIIGRLLLLILNVLLLVLSALYCMGQRYESTLDLVTRCEGRTIEQIRQHSYELGVMENGEVQMSPASHWGATGETDPCWTTHKLSTDTEKLWYSNLYTADLVDEPINFESVAFGLLTVYCVVLIIYNMYTLITDCMHASQRTLHETSKKYKYFMEHHNNINAAAQPPTIESRCQRIMRCVDTFWSKYMGNDTTGWIIRGVISEITEIAIQTQALMLYNGYNVLDPHNESDIYLANKSYFIVMFAAILAFNCIGSGVLWCAYALINKYCHGLFFKLLLFWVDECSDLFYTLFPFAVIVFDTYNADKNDIRILLAQLNTESSAIAFISSFLPLFLLVSKSLSITRSAQRQLADKYCAHWKLIHDVSQQTNDDQAVYQAQLNGWKLGGSLQANKESFGSKGNLLLSLNKTITRTNWIRTTQDDKVSRKRQCILIILGVLYMIYGVGLLRYVLNHVHNAHKHCSMIDETIFFDKKQFNINSTVLTDSQYKLFQGNPELFFWSKCLYKVYPFTNGIKGDPYNHPCQCRVFVIDWENTTSTEEQRNVHFNLTQPILLSNMLTHWFQLGKFRTRGKSENAGTKITKDMFRAKYMKAFEWAFAPITCIQEGISQWEELEYFKLHEVTLRHLLPDDFEGLTKMKFLSFIENGLPTFPDSICNLQSLQVLEMVQEIQIESIPPCVAKLIDLEQLIIENCIVLKYIPLSVFALPNLVILSLFHIDISLSSLIEYNVPNKSIQNNTDMAIQWLQNTLKITPSMDELYLTSSPICDENVTWFPMEFNISEACYTPCISTHTATQFCSSRLMRDGKCDYVCGTSDCYGDGGDCLQLCFSPLTNCTYDLYTNDVCDEACNNNYCTNYYDEKFTQPRIAHVWDPVTGTVVALGPDNHHCKIHYERPWPSSNNSYNLTCEASKSDYIDLNPKDFSNCRRDWIGDDLCDDLCRTDECNQDDGDCDVGSCTANVCKYIYDLWLLFAPDRTYNINISYFCNTIHPNAVAIFGTDLISGLSCERPSAFYTYDWNNDSHVNFREWTYVTYWFGGGWREKGKQLNCSECIGMEHYNIKYEINENNASTNVFQPED